ncbi:hypothetical protein BGZ63DRAFT_419188 [Mariannaea sp. PMI_226]|nr:hypothetical protein BGZ63DRAFT_419188 [Mariannaea sp. PMI_226]
MDINIDWISTASIHQLQSVLVALCADGEVRHRASRHWASLSASLEDPKDVVICMQCDKSFSIKKKDAEVCLYHPEELEVDFDSDVWADHDEKCHGPEDTEENRREFPDGFIYPCCQGQGDAPGCERSKHEEYPDQPRSENGKALMPTTDSPQRLAFVTGAKRKAEDMPGNAQQAKGKYTHYGA